MTSNLLEPVQVQCPCCWEMINILVDCSIEEQEYIEDCQVCCRPIVMSVLVDEAGYPEVSVRSDES